MTLRCTSAFCTTLFFASRAWSLANSSFAALFVASSSSFCRMRLSMSRTAKDAFIMLSWVLRSHFDWFNSSVAASAPAGSASAISAAGFVEQQKPLQPKWLGTRARAVRAPWASSVVATRNEFGFGASQWLTEVLKTNIRSDPPCVREPAPSQLEGLRATSPTSPRCSAAAWTHGAHGLVHFKANIVHAQRSRATLDRDSPESGRQTLPTSSASATTPGDDDDDGDDDGMGRAGDDPCRLTAHQRARPHTTTRRFVLQRGGGRTGEHLVGTCYASATRGQGESIRQRTTMCFAP